MKKTSQGMFYLTLLALTLFAASPASAIVCGCFCQGLVPTRPCNDPRDPAVQNCGDWLDRYGYTCSSLAAAPASPASLPSFLSLDSQPAASCTAPQAPIEAQRPAPTSAPQPNR